LAEGDGLFHISTGKTLEQFAVIHTLSMEFADEYEKSAGKDLDPDDILPCMQAFEAHAEEYIRQIMDKPDFGPHDWLKKHEK
jgi:hypothetical protein